MNVAINSKFNSKPYSDFKKVEFSKIQPVIFIRNEMHTKIVFGP